MHPWSHPALPVLPAASRGPDLRIKQNASTQQQQQKKDETQSQHSRAQSPKNISQTPFSRLFTFPCIQQPVSLNSNRYPSSAAASSGPEARLRNQSGIHRSCIRRKKRVEKKQYPPKHQVKASTECNRSFGYLNKRLFLSSSFLMQKNTKLNSCKDNSSSLKKASSLMNPECIELCVHPGLKTAATRRRLRRRRRPMGNRRKKRSISYKLKKHASI